MGIVRKYACHRLYDAPDHYFPQSVVSIDENGKTIGHALLTEETSSTEWIGGIIILTGQKELPTFRNFHDLQRVLTKDPICTYAWHISCFDFQNNELMPESIIRRL